MIEAAIHTYTHSTHSSTHTAHILTSRLILNRAMVSHVQ